MHREDERQRRSASAEQRAIGLARAAVWIVDERRPVQRDEAVTARFEPMDAPRLVCARGIDVLEQRVDHRVADEMHEASVDPFGGKVVDGARGMCEQDRAEVVGEPAVVLLRHRRIEAAQPGLEVRDRDVELDRGERAGERRVHVAGDDDEGGPPLEEHLLDADERPRGLLGVRAGADAEEDVGLRQAELARGRRPTSRRRSAGPCGRAGASSGRRRRGRRAPAPPS